MPTNGLHLVSNVAGMSKEKAQRLWDQVRANHARLESCGNHGFVPIDGTSGMRARYRCMRCLGEVDSTAYRWFTCGRQHATDQMLDAGYRPPL